MPDATVLVVAGLAILVGAVIQGSIGFGLGVFASPILILIDPPLVPGAMLVVASVLPFFSFLREWRHTDWRGFALAFAGRLPGTVAGVWLVAALPAEALGVAVGVMVLVAIALTARMFSMPRNALTLSVAGFVSGTTGTATAIGGPPMGIVYQHGEAPMIRATLSAFFFAGSVVSLAGLAIGGELPARSFFTGLILLPFMLLGFVISGPLRRYLYGGRMRAALLGVAALSALVLIIRSLW